MTHKVPTRLSIFERTITQVFWGRKISSILNFEFVGLNGNEKIVDITRSFLVL